MIKVPIAKPYINKDDIDGILGVLKSGYLSLGPVYKKFEQDMAIYTGAKYACAISSGTAGLHLAVKALNIKEGDEVITTPFSFIASSNCILYEKAKPVFVDIEEGTLNIDPTKIEKAITKKTKALLIVHIFGQSADMNPIMQIARKYNLKVIEDSCESLGATYRNKMTGTFGDVGIYSFYPNKQMTTGEGAILVTNSKIILELVDGLRNQGRGLQKSSKDKDWNWLTSERMGYNYRMDEMSASLGVTQLKKLDWMINERRKIIKIYNQLLAVYAPKIKTPQVGVYRTHTWFVYVIRVMNGKRNYVMQSLLNDGIQVRPYLPSIHMQPFMKKIFKYKKGDFPISEKVSSEALALPLFIGLKKSDIQYICKKIGEYL